MDRRVAAAAAAACVALLPAARSLAVVAFPGADGFGANALGGRGGLVYHVTNLTDDTTTPAPGSFRAVLAQVAADEKNAVTTAATVVFDVGGTIPLTSNISVKGVSNVTIAGQTAPGPGITLTGYKFQVTSSSGTKPIDVTSNVIVRYIASRRGNTIDTSNDDAIGVLGSTSDPNHNTHDIILDHVTAAWGMDENLSVTDSASNVTVSNSFINEALQSGHQFGSLIRPRFGASVSYIGNLYANNRSRNPRPGSYNSSTLNFDFRNNTVYNWSDRAGYTGGASEVGTETVNMNYTGNYLVAGPSTPSDFHQNSAFIVDTSSADLALGKDNLNIQVYQSSNRVDTNRNGVADGADTGWNAFVRYNGTTVSAFDAATNPAVTTGELASPNAFAVPGTATTDPSLAFQQMMANAGTTPWNRFESDARVINQIKTNGGAVLLTAPAAEYTDLLNQAAVTRAAGFDADQDGMADSWERARGLNPAAAADRNSVVTAAESPAMAGYTWLEVYLNDLTMQANWAGGTSGAWGAIPNWNGQLPGQQDSTANFGNVGAAAQVSVASPQRVGQLSFDNPSGYTLTGAGGITMDVMRKAGGTGGYATIAVGSGNHVIATPLALAADLAVDAPAASSLTVSDFQPAPGRNLLKTGAGALVVNRLNAGSLTVSGGTVQISSGSGGGNRLDALSVAGGARVDVTTNAVVLSAGGTGSWIGDSYTGTSGMIASGRNGGDWQGSGIITTAAGASDYTTIGVATGAEAKGLAGSDTDTWGGQTVHAGDTLVMFTYGGDANLDGQINIDDYTQIDSSVSAGGTLRGWYNGDFNYDGEVNIDDYTIIDSNIGIQGAPFPTGAAISAAAVSAVPEPASLALLAGVAAIAGRRRRRSSAR